MVLHRKVNIIITGTPGTGKTSHAQLLAEQVDGLKVLDMNAIAKGNNCVVEYDEERKSHVVDEEKVLDVVEDDLELGSKIIDWHVCDVFPERLIDLVVVLRSETSVLYDRLKERGYEQKKIDENMDCEIMEIILNEARETYDEDFIVQLNSNSMEEMQANVDRIAEWIKTFEKEHPHGVRNAELQDTSDSDSD